MELVSIFIFAFIQYWTFPHINTPKCEFFNCIDISDDNFENEVLYADVLVVVEFWAVWCGPCKMLSPVLEEVNDHFTGKLKIVKMNIDESAGTYPRFGVRGIPTMLFFKSGNVVHQNVGLFQTNELISIIDNLLSEPWLLNKHIEHYKTLIMYND